MLTTDIQLKTPAQALNSRCFANQNEIGFTYRNNGCNVYIGLLYNKYRVSAACFPDLKIGGR